MCQQHNSRTFMKKSNNAEDNQLGDDNNCLLFCRGSRSLQSCRAPRGPHLVHRGHLTGTETEMEGKWRKEMMWTETTRTRSGESLNKAEEWGQSHQKERWQERGKKRRDASEAGVNPNKRKQRSLCYQEPSGAPANSKSDTESTEVCGEEVKNTAGFGETVPDLNWENTENKILVLWVPCGSRLQSGWRLHSQLLISLSAHFTKTMLHCEKPDWFHKQGPISPKLRLRTTIKTSLFLKKT